MNNLGNDLNLLFRLTPKSDEDSAYLVKILIFQEEDQFDRWSIDDFIFWMISFNDGLLEMFDSSSITTHTGS